MGIHNLAKLLADAAASAIKENEMKNYFGRKIAIDASMSLYQFLIAIRQDGSQMLNESGETTSHLMGMLYRTIRMIENGIKPVYVFDGKPPTLKSEELTKRAEKRKEAESEHEKAVEKGDQEAIDKFSRRTVRVTSQHNDEVKKLLKLMGVPYVEAPCEAEAQCAHMAKSGVVYAAATEDMDCLTFGTKVLLRHMTCSEAKKMPIKEIHLDKVLSELKLNQNEFIDMCILLGCDYCEGIKGIGPKKAIDLITQYRSLEEVVKHIDTKKYPVPENWRYKDARDLFQNHEVADIKDADLKWNEPDEEGLIEYLVKEKNFNEERIRNAAKRLSKSKSNSSQQGRIDTFFTSTGTTSTKRKPVEDLKKGGSDKRAKLVKTKEKKPVASRKK